MNEDNQNVSNPLSLDDLPLSPKGQRQRRRRSRSRIRKTYSRFKRLVNFRAIFIFVIFALVISLLSFAVLIVDSNAKLTSSWQSMNRILGSLQSRQGANITLSDFERIRLATNDLHQQIGTTLQRLSLLSPIANVNEDLRTVIDLLDVSEQILSSTEIMMVGLEPSMNFLVQGADNEVISTQISSGERLAELLDIGRGRFLESNRLLMEAKDRLDSIQLGSVSPFLLLNYSQISDFQEQLQTLNSIFLSSPDILSQVMGVGDEVTYLVLAQNNDEIRPSGGYISTYGWFNVRNGRITNYNYSSTSATSPSPPDESFVDTFEIPDWWLNFQNPVYAAWDGSWYADFPSTADLALKYYNAGKNPNYPVDGVVSIDITGFELILEVLGDVAIPEYSRTVNVDNFREVVYDIRTYGDLEHKRFLSTVYRHIFADWQSIEQDSSSELVTALLEALTQKHIMIYLADDSAQEVIRSLGWSGEQLVPDVNDYIMVADANLGNKSNDSVIRSLTYDVEIMPDQSLLSNLRVRYDYFDSVASQDPAVDSLFHGPLDYRTLTQVFLPSGITLIDTENVRTPDPVSFDPYTLLVSRIDVEYDTSERIQLNYESEPQIDRVGDYYRYRLLIQKQPGARVQDVNMQIRLPQGSDIITISPEADASYELEQPILDYRFPLISDQWIEIIYALYSDMDQ